MSTASSARAWTEAPASLGQLWRQRYRWSYGTLQAMWKHRHAVLEPEHHHLGRRALPSLLLFQVLLPALGPAIDVFALYGVLFLDPLPVVAYWLGFNAIQLALGIYAFRLDGERLGPLWLLPLQQFVYRQLDVPRRDSVPCDRGCRHPSPLAQAAPHRRRVGTDLTMAWLSDRSRDGGVDEIPLPADVPGRLFLCGKHAIGPDPDGLLTRVGATTVVCLNEAYELRERFPDFVAWLKTQRARPCRASPDTRPAHAGRG